MAMFRLAGVVFLVGFLVPSPSLSGFIAAGDENGEDDDWDGDKVESRIVDVFNVGAVSDHDSLIFAHVTAIGNAIIDAVVSD